MAEAEKKYTYAYGQLRRLTSTIDGQIRQLSVSKGNGLQLALRTLVHLSSMVDRRMRDTRKLEGRAKEYLESVRADRNPRRSRRRLIYAFRVLEDIRDAGDGDAPKLKCIANARVVPKSRNYDERMRRTHGRAGRGIYTAIA